MQSNAMQQATICSGTTMPKDASHYEYMISRGNGLHTPRHKV